MYQDDYYHPTQEFVLQNVISEIKSLDKGYHTFKKNFLTSNGKKNISVELYSSGDIGANIRDAITGQYYGLKVGSVAEDYFFTVRLLTGEVDSNSKHRKFFFASPNDYERVFHTTLNERKKYNWNKKNHI